MICCASKDGLMPLSKLDHAALLDCLMLGEPHPDIGRCPVNSDDDWFERATWSCFVLQYRDLNLKPWQPTPSDVDPDGTDEHGGGARVLLKRMLALGMSRYDPRPSRALPGRRRR